jgi:transposase
LYNPEGELTERDKLYGHTFWLKENVSAGKKLPGFEQDIKKYLDSSGGLLRIRQEVIDKELSNSGWIVIIGNETISTQESHDIYRKKDVVEKAFRKIKNNLGMNRLRVHDEERMRNKALVSFMSLVLISLACYQRAAGDILRLRLDPTACRLQIFEGNLGYRQPGCRLKRHI